MKDFIHNLCAGLRVDELPGNNFTVIVPTDDRADALSRAFGDSGKVTGGREGHEYLRQLGLVQHVFALRLGKFRVRIVGPGYPPAGMFSDLPRLERRITAP